MYLQDGGQASGQWEQHTRDDREQHSRTKWRWSVLICWCGCVGGKRAALVIQKNIATSLNGGVCTYMTGVKPQGSGNSTRVTIENNTAGQNGGGVSSCWCGVLVESGRRL